MKISNEVKVGVVALLTIAAFIWLYSFLKGSELFTKTATYNIIYKEIGGLKESSPVEINGYQAGIVQDIKFINDGSGRLAVSVSVDKNFDLPVGTTAEITTASLIAGMKIILIMGDSKEIHSNHDTIPGILATSIIDRIGDQLSPVEGNITHMIVKLDSLITRIHDVFSPQFSSDIKASLDNVNGITANLREISDKEKEALMASISDLNKFTTMLSANSSSLDATLKNIASISDTLASADLAGALGSLRSSLVSTDSILRGLNSGTGTAGKLMTNDSLYNNLNNSLNSLDNLLQDMKDNPKKYVHFSLFGRKDQ